MNEMKIKSNDGEYWDHEMATLPEEIHRLFTGISRCSYHLGDYANSIVPFGEGAIFLDRSIRDVHKYVALSHKALGNIEAAKKTMARAVLYEAPWDEVQKAKNMKLYEEMDGDHTY